jgi:hypothetical protein
MTGGNMKVPIGSLTGFLLIAALMGIAGCGGGNSETTTALTKNQFVTRSNKICEHGLEEVKNAYASFAVLEKMNKSEREEMIRGLLPPFQAMIDELRELPAPVPDQQKIAKILLSFEAALESLDEEPARGLSGEYPFTEATDPAAKYGMIECVP